MSYWENLKRHIELVEEKKFIQLGDALIYTGNKDDYLAGKLYLQPDGKYCLISDEFEIACTMDNLRLVNDEFEEFWFKMLGHGWYFKKEDGIFVGRHIR